MSRTIDISISDSGVRVVTQDNGFKNQKMVSLESLRNIFVSDDIEVDTGLLPVGVRLYRKTPKYEYILLETPPTKRKVSWDGDYEYTIPVPWFLWFIRLVNEGGKKYYSFGNVCAMKNPLFSLDSSEVFRFPFSNVDNYICWGKQDLPSWKTIMGVSSLPDLFFSASFNADLDTKRYHPYQLDDGMTIQSTHSLFKALDGKDEFPLEILISEGTAQSQLNIFMSRG